MRLQENIKNRKMMHHDDTAGHGHNHEHHHDLMFVSSFAVTLTGKGWPN